MTTSDSSRADTAGGVTGKDEIARALALGTSPVLADRTIDITTTGRVSGRPRRIEIVFYLFDGEIYLSGVPTPRKRAWLSNLTAEPHFTFHLKSGVVADLPAEASVIDDAGERRRILPAFVDQFNERRTPNDPHPAADLDAWVASSPLARVTFL